MICLTRSHVRKMLEHLEGEYPKEACGVFMGRRRERPGGQVIEVSAVRRLANADAARPGDRYEMNPEELLQAEDEARRAEAGVVGIYHSHPDRSASPSPIDLEKAWPGYAYLVASIRGGEAAEWACWVLDTSRRAFQPCVVQLAGNGVSCRS
jgi:proteasome lid subunit RPN8/RPN11